MAARKKAAKRKPVKRKQATPLPPRPNGRPSMFTAELGERVCELLAEGESLLKIAEHDWAPNSSTMRRWLRNDGIPASSYLKFRADYEKARTDQAAFMFDDINRIVDDTDALGTNKARLQMDARKWILARMDRKLYGDKQDVSLGGIPGSEPIQTQTNIQVDNLTSAQKAAAAKLARAALNKGA